MAKKILLRPYAGYVLIAKTKKEFLQLFKKHEGHDCTFPIGQGVTSRMPLKRGQLFIIYAKDNPSLMHEFCHVLLDLFEYIQANPTGCNGEPFAYMMSYLVEEARK